MLATATFVAAQTSFSEPTKIYVMHSSGNHLEMGTDGGGWIEAPTKSSPQQLTLIPDGQDPYEVGSTSHGHVTVNITGGKIGNEYEYRYLTSSVDISGKTAEEIAEARTTELQETYHLPLTNAEYSSDRGYYLLNHILELFIRFKACFVL